MDMEIAIITENGQITLPKSVRKKLNLKDGGKIGFIEKDGELKIVNPTVLAFEEMQDAMAGEAERLGLKDVDDVVKMIKEMRAERRKEEK